MGAQRKIGFWTRMVADAVFRDAVLADPLRAMGDVDDVDVSAEQIRRLEEMSYDERMELVTEVVRDAYFRGALARFGPLREDGSLGGPEPPAQG